MAVCQVLTRLKYNEPQLLAIFGGKQIMIESPLIQEIVAERMHKDILGVLEARLGRATGLGDGAGSHPRRADARRTRETRCLLPQAECVSKASSAMT